MVGDSLIKVIGGLVLFAYIGALLIIVALCYGGYKVVDYFFIEDTITIESKTLINPEIKLHTDGKTIDTIYVYTQKTK